MSNTGRRRLNIVGAINAISLKPTIILTEANCNKELILEYLKHLKEEYKDKMKITVILDNASYNRAYEVQDYAKENQIELFYLPPYSPNLNLIERLWRFFKKKIIKNNYYKEFKEFEEKVTIFFKDYDKYYDELKNLLTLNFGIIKANQYINLVIQVERLSKRKTKTSYETSYYVSSLETEDAEEIGLGIRNHWSIENRLHWVKDVIQNEDNSRIKKKMA